MLPLIDHDQSFYFHDSYFRWLDHVRSRISSGMNEIGCQISWSAFHASMEYHAKEINDLSVLLPLFQEESKSPAMIQHRMDVIKGAVHFLNNNQTPVMACDQPLYAIAKQIQWNLKTDYGEDKFVIMMGSLHIEMAGLKMLGNWLEDIGWCSALTEANIASPGVAQSFIYASHVSRTRSAHQVTACALNVLMEMAYKTYIMSSGEPLTFSSWRSRHERMYPQFRFWSMTLDLQLKVLLFVRSI